MGRAAARARRVPLARRRARLWRTRYYTQHREVMATAEQRRNFIPNVRVATVRPSNRITLVTLPATTLAFSAANLFARSSGYIDKRLVDIGDRVKDGQLLAAISVPELDHQISQNEAGSTQICGRQVGVQITIFGSPAVPLVNIGVYRRNMLRVSHFTSR